MAEEKKNGNGRLSQVLAIAGMLGAIGGVWGTLSADNADTKRRVDTVEKRQAEDRELARREQWEIKKEVKQISENVTQIRILLESMKHERR